MGYRYYVYEPTLVGAAVFVVLFAISTIAHLGQLVMKRTWYFIPFVVGGLFETVGYVGRAMSAKETPDWTMKPYIMQSLLILLGPTLFAASIYMILGRIIRLTNGEAHSIIRVNWVTKIFVLGDVLSFLAQSGGGGMLAKASAPSDQKNGERLITIGLVIQIAFFGFFIVVAGLFHVRINMYPTARSQQATVPWQKFLFVLYGAGGLIMIRSLYRLIEYIQGASGELQSKEAYLYVFDATLMFLTALMFNIFHPSKIISKESLAEASYMMQTGETDEMVPGRKQAAWQSAESV
ncbi:uncharacterized protein K452DRAFT_348162 [Aplosporella prunicola CBS 121167]|uniref:RTA1 like protein n=1 Tax=Aplosporella prunicola CBS 121167 TaxID=1176127 RepID=A0A6A6BXJ5_9PEZI|nr:uncharacterized protein K452DRAFT_348162 [Aplosporella prunicola CBS 121167]KAF2147461.1 hypothetical protein K452DRAFT_348162 [Aplosporella prunicola CBS 121167]